MPEHSPAPEPSRGVYGFALFLFFKIFFILYIMYAVIPEAWFRSIGITYLPKRYWAITFPIFLLTVLAVFAFIIYPSLGLVMTPNVNEYATIKDKCFLSKRKFELKETVNNKGNCCKNLKNCKKEYFNSICNDDFFKNCIPSLQDISFDDISKHLYLK